MNVVNFLRDQTTYLAISERFMEANQESVRKEVKEKERYKYPISVVYFSSLIGLSISQIAVYPKIKKIPVQRRSGQLRNSNKLGIDMLRRKQGAIVANLKLERSGSSDHF